MTYADYQYSVKSIDKDVKEGRLSREEARRSLDKLKKAYQSGEVNRSIADAASKSKGMVIK